MKLSELKSALKLQEYLSFVLPDGSSVPPHFHITEVGQVQRHFMDCGGTVRTTLSVSMQLWVAEDTTHRLSAAKLINIIEKSETWLQLQDAVVEIEYQMQTIGKYRLALSEHAFVLLPTFTQCLAEDACGIPPAKTKLNLSELTGAASCCSQDSNCC